MKNKDIKSYIEQAIRKLPDEGQVAHNVGGIKYYLKKAIAILEQPEPVQQELAKPAIKKAIPMNEQYNFQPLGNVNVTNAARVVQGLELMIEQEKKKLEEIQNRKKKPKDDENVEQIFG